MCNNDYIRSLTEETKIDVELVIKSIRENGEQTLKAIKKNGKETRKAIRSA